MEGAWVVSVVESEGVAMMEREEVVGTEETMEV